MHSGHSHVSMGGPDVEEYDSAHEFITIHAYVYDLEIQQVNVV